ncbi:hypothetical protein PPERSA_07695 [Pseudocohnilembus persalinus]|uniref:PIN domain-containing protein n=1 Tax=Pseudocohnilembus persalinus TaxID=266149 RepID=A0A0V0QII8_PSEPJ|nr:hypothetical protein PPERSA_07695 [Pseudocohnilembus persalinus]|eukprot:KRX02050.1 hypothetical protein PPERSA_07695 [Pseudocohnilembus persalinus]
MADWDQDIIIPTQEQLEKQKLDDENNQEQDQTDKKPQLIIDTNAFIRCLDILNLSKTYDIYSSPNVLREIRDKRAREKFASLPFSIGLLECSEESYNFVKRFALATGDYASLSQIDMELIAVAYEQCIKQGKGEFLRKEPPKAQNLEQLRQMQQKKIEEQKKKQQEEEEKKQLNGENNSNDNQENKDENKNNQADDYDYLASETESDEGEDYDSQEDENQQENNDSQQQQVDDDGWVTVKPKVQKKVEQKQDFDDNKGWINPDNLQKFLKKSQQQEKDRQIGIYCMTADYAMQNVILQIGIPLLSIDNMVIRRAKRFILECFACKEQCLDSTKKFCPACKNDTLLKVSCSINADGTIYSIPKFKPGRRQNNLILREDELLLGENKQKLKKGQKKQEKAFKQAMFDLEAGYQFADKKFNQIQGTGIQIGYGNKNPNDQYHIKNKRNKK